MNNEPMAGRATDSASQDAAIERLYRDWIALDEKYGRTMDALAEAEAKASRNAAKWDDTPEINSIHAEQDALSKQLANLTHQIAMTRASGILGLTLKLALWRRQDQSVNSGHFGDVSDTLPFSAYIDLVEMVGVPELRHPSDEKTSVALRTWPQSRQSRSNDA